MINDRAGLIAKFKGLVKIVVDHTLESQECIDATTDLITFIAQDQGRVLTDAEVDGIKNQYQGAVTNLIMSPNQNMRELFEDSYIKTIEWVLHG
jgi:hypothetical protein